MAAFAPDFTAVQNDLGDITFIDTSNYPGDEAYVKADFERSIVLTDAYGDTAATLLFDNTNPFYNPDTDAIVYPLTTNKWYVVELALSGAQSYSKIKKFPFQRIFEVAYAEAVQSGCDCGCQGAVSDDNLCSADTFYQNAAWAVPTGDGVDYQANIDSAYKFLL